jgi:hypothetical protein
VLVDAAKTQCRSCRGDAIVAQIGMFAMIGADVITRAGKPMVAGSTGKRRARRVLWRVSLMLVAAATAGCLFAFIASAQVLADAAAYYVGGGKGVKLAVRVVDRQIVWAKLSVRERCYGSRRGYYHHTDSSEGLFGQAPIGSRGAFSSHSGYRNLGKKGDEEVVVENISGRAGPRRLAGRILSYAWFNYSDPVGTNRHGYCRGAGAGPRPPAHPEPVPITAHRRPEPPGLDFYFAGREHGITAYFEVRGRSIRRAEVGDVRYCTDPRGRRYYNYEVSTRRVPIRIRPSGRFYADEVSDDTVRSEFLRGEVTSGRVVGSYGFATSFEDGRHCRTGSFEPGGDRPWAVPFVAPRR